MVYMADSAYLLSVWGKKMFIRSTYSRYTEKTQQICFIFQVKKHQSLITEQKVDYEKKQGEYLKNQEKLKEETVVIEKKHKHVYIIFGIK